MKSLKYKKYIYIYAWSKKRQFSHWSEFQTIKHYNHLYAQYNLAVLCVLNSRFQSNSHKISIIPYHPWLHFYTKNPTLCGFKILKIHSTLNSIKQETQHKISKKKLKIFVLDKAHILWMSLLYSITISRVNFTA